MILRQSVNNLQKAYLKSLWHILKILKVLGIKELGPYKLARLRRISEVYPREGGLLLPAPEIRVPISAETEVSRQMYPELGYRRITAAKVTTNTRFTSVLAKEQLLIQESAGPEPWKVAVGPPIVAGIRRYEFPHALIKESKSRATDKGILVGTTSPLNWYSWLWDILPSIHLSQKLPNEFDSFPLLIPERVLGRPHWTEGLDFLAGGREIFPLPWDSYLEVRDLVWIDSPNCPGPISERTTDAPAFGLHGEAYRRFRRHLIAEHPCSKPQQEFQRKIFLARRIVGSVRSYNQEDCLEVAARVGFTPVYPEELSLCETIHTFGSARFVIGPHGAGWTNALFSLPSAKGLLWTWLGTRRDNWYANVAAISGMNLQIHETNGINGNRFDMDPTVLESKLSDLLDREHR